MSSKKYWSSRLGFYLAAVGSAVGLGNLWRFPYIVGENGGGAFVLLYLFFAVAVGLPLLIGELSLGKQARRPLLPALLKFRHPLLKTRSLPPRVIKGLGLLSLSVTGMILAYYAVVSGWVLHFSTQFLVGLFVDDWLTARSSFAPLMSNGALQISLASVHILALVVISLRGIQDGLEKWISRMMPVFGFLLFLLLIQALSLPSTSEALRFLFYPDFTKLTLSSPLHALGHVLFTLSLGIGAMVTFGSFLRESDQIPKAGYRVTFVDIVLSLVAGLLIFPLVFQGGGGAQLTDPGLLFETLPRFLIELRLGSLFGLMFFVCLYLSALSASLGLLEVILSHLMDAFKWTRAKACVVAGLLALALSVLPGLSSSVLKNVRFSGGSILESLDSLLIHWALPLIALGMSYFLAYQMPKNIKQEMFGESSSVENQIMYVKWEQSLKFSIPVIIGLCFLLKLLSYFF